MNIDAVLEDIVANVPAPSGDPNAPLQALVFDSQYDPYVGVVVYFRIRQGTLRRGQTIRLMATGAQYTILECGYLKPLGNEPTDALQAGEVGYFTASIKTVKDTQVGDTVTDAENPPRSLCPATGPPSLWSTAASTPRMAASIRTCGTPWKSSSSTMPP